jgi:hypothetical protein
MMKLIKPVEITKSVSKPKKVKINCDHARKAQYVYDVTTDPAHTKYDEELEDELLSPTLSDIGSEGEEGDIYEHLDEVEPTRKERYEGSGACIWFVQGCK